MEDDPRHHASGAITVPPPGSATGTVTTPAWRSPSFWTETAGEVVFIWGLLEASPLLTNLPAEWQGVVIVVGGLVKLLGKWLKHRGLQQGILQVESTVQAVETKADVAIGGVQEVAAEVALVRGDAG